MRVEVIFRVDKDIILDKSMNDYITAFIYKCIGTNDTDYSKQLHDEGYLIGYKKYKYYTYSLRQNKKYVSNKLSKGEVSLCYSSAVDKSVLNFVKGLIKIGKMIISNYEFEIVSIEEKKEPTKFKEGIYTITSPVYMTDINNKWLSPQEMEPYLVRNLINKYNCLYDELPNLDLQIKFLDHKTYYVKYKQYIYKTYFGHIAIKGDSELIKIAFQAGLGSQKGAGFGMIDEIK